MIGSALFIAQVVTLVLAIVGLMPWSVNVFIPGILLVVWAFIWVMIAEAVKDSRYRPPKTGIKAIRSYPPDENGEY